MLGSDKVTRELRREKGGALWGGGGWGVSAAGRGSRQGYGLFMVGGGAER